MTSMHKNILAGLVFTTSLITLAACSARTPQVLSVPMVDKPGELTVTGTATLEVSPDCADLTMTIMTEGARPGLAAATAQAQQRELVDALSKLGVENADLKLSHLRLQPVYAEHGLGWTSQRITSYRAEITVTATTERFDQLGAIMDAGASAGVTSMSSLFRRSDLPELKKQVRDMALKAARDKAAQTAKGLGIELGRVVTVSELPAGAPWGTPNYVANESAVRTTSMVLGGTLQSLTLEITVGFELPKRG